MTRMSGSGRSRPIGPAYFIRRFGDACDVIELQPGDREVIVASGFAPGEAEDLCASKIEALQNASPSLPLADAGPAPAAPTRKKHGGGQLVFRF
jgi:hypothetical protein